MPQSNTRFYKQDSGDKLYRRSLYTFWKRSAPPASMDIFNAPTREHATVERERTNTPLQALVTMNDTQFVEASRYLAQKAMREAGRRVRCAARLRDRASPGPPSRGKGTRGGEELLRCVPRFVPRAAPRRLGKLLDVGESPADEALPGAEFAAWTMLVSELLNLDEVLNK